MENGKENGWEKKDEVRSIGRDSLKERIDENEVVDTLLFLYSVIELPKVICRFLIFSKVKYFLWKNRNKSCIMK